MWDCGCFWTQPWWRPYSVAWTVTSHGSRAVARPARRRRRRASRASGRGRTRVRSQQLGGERAHVARSSRRPSARTRRVASGTAARARRWTITPWRSPRPAGAPPPRVSTWTSTPSRDELLGQLAHVAGEPALDHRRVLPGDQQDAHGAAGPYRVGAVHDTITCRERLRRAASRRSPGRPDPIDPGVRIGHTHLRTADIDRIRDFYVGVLGFDVISRGSRRSRLGDDRRHPVRLGRRLPPPSRLQHLAVEGRRADARRRSPASPRRDRLSDPSRGWPTPYRRLKDADWPIRQHTDHGTHEAIYIVDPDGNTLELMWDRPAEEWPRDADGHIDAQFGPDLDLDDLLRELD